MLRLADNRDTLIVNACDYYGKKVDSYYKAYGTRYDFCRFYSNDNGGIILMYNALAVVCGEGFDADELTEFIRVFSPASIEMPPDLFSILVISGYTAKRRTMFRMAAFPTQSREKLHINKDFPLAFSILREGFPMTEDDYPQWYTDLSHRIRHGTAALYTYGGHSTAALQFCADGFAFVSHIATAENERGKGYAREMLYKISAAFDKSGDVGYLWALGHRTSYYSSIGFTPVGHDFLLEMTD